MKTRQFSPRMLIAIAMLVVVVLVIIFVFLTRNTRSTPTQSDGLHTDFYISCVDTGQTVTEDMGTNEAGISASMTLKVFECMATSPDGSVSRVLNLSMAESSQIFGASEHCDSMDKQLQADIVIDSETYDQVLQPFTCVDRLADTQGRKPI